MGLEITKDTTYTVSKSPIEVRLELLKIARNIALDVADSKGREIAGAEEYTKAILKVAIKLQKFVQCDIIEPND